MSNFFSSGLDSFVHSLVKALEIDGVQFYEPCWGNPRQPIRCLISTHFVSFLLEGEFQKMY